MTRWEIITSLLNHFFDYEDQDSTSDEYSLDEFIGYLNSKSKKDNVPMRIISGEISDPFPEYTNKTLSNISILLVLMYRYARIYLKQAIKGSALNTPDEFSFLITLMTYKNMRKGELINRQVMEKTSGTEVIRRLLRRGMIAESDDINDKRGKLISITEQGRNEILKILPQMGNVSEIIVGNLSNDEVNTLSYLLKKLDHFHNDIYRNKKDLSLEDILQKIDRSTGLEL
jgi:DNA-binding MarR family transcriptional regulator